MALTEDNFQEAANVIGCDTAVIKAVYQVESNHQGYLNDGRIKILFEGHRFWKQLVKAGKDPQDFISHYPEYSNVLYKNWDKSKYKGGSSEWDRMSQAIEVCEKLNVEPELALKSASYGSFQIMGENCIYCGYATAQEMINKYNIKGEQEQLDSFCRFVKSQGIALFLKNKQWDLFSLHYNGTGYRENQYNIKLEAAYNSFL